MATGFRASRYPGIKGIRPIGENTTGNLLQMAMAGQGALVILGLVTAVAGQLCMPPFVPVGGKCLHVELSDQGSSMTWQEARDYCKSLASNYYSDLATFPTCDQYTQFARYIELNGKPNATIWMGAHTAFTPNMWQWVTMESLETGVPFWYHGETFSQAYECAASDRNYFSRLVAADCNDQKAFACTYTPVAEATAIKEKQPRPNCPNEGIPVGDFCYVFKSETENFDTAERRCRDEHDAYQGELYYPSSCDEFANMAHHLETSEDLNAYWVGAIDISGQEEWFWVSGNAVPGGPPFWASGQPSHDHENGPREHCAAMANGQRFYLNDEHCSEHFHFICKLQLDAPVNEQDD